jgi:hypothetical protein
MSVVEEESDSDNEKSEKILYTLSHFENVLYGWWTKADGEGKGNVTLSAERLALTLVADDVFKEIETTRRNIIL